MSPSDHNLVLPDGRVILSGNHYDKYNSRNPIARLLMKGYLDTLKNYLEKLPYRTAHEVGCGEGHLAGLIRKPGTSYLGSDIGPGIVAHARRLHGEEEHLSFKNSAIADLDPNVDSAELVIACQVLEHLINPYQSMKVLSALADPYIICSVPREPIWCALNMARLKYLTDFGNTPGHLHHWSKHSFIKFVSGYFEILDVATPFPWTMILAKKK